MLERTMVITVRLPAGKSDQDLALVVEPFLRDTLETMGGSLTEWSIETTDVEDEDLEPPVEDEDGGPIDTDPNTAARVAAVAARGEFIRHWREANPGYTYMEEHDAIGQYDAEHPLGP